MVLGHWIQNRSIDQAAGALKELAKLLPDRAERIVGERTEVVPSPMSAMQTCCWFVLAQVFRPMAWCETARAT